MSQAPRRSQESVRNWMRRVAPALALIGLTSAILLVADRDRRVSGPRSAPRTRPRIALLQWASTDLLDDTVAGILEGLRRQGFTPGHQVEVRCLNASGDSAAGNMMAREMAAGRYDLLVTASTLALQAVAQANAEGRTPHLFGAVTDPYGAGVGITGPAPDQHPPHLAGIGTFQPVERAFRLAKTMNPALHKVGTVWNPGESNSEACLEKARAICQELGVELIEATAGHTAEVPEAVRALLSRDIQALWVGGDTVAIASIAALVSAARAVRVPVFSNDPTDVKRGVFFGLGASYREVGILVGSLAAQVLNGVAPRTFRVENQVPERLAVNKPLVADFPGWTLPADTVPLPDAEPQPAAPEAAVQRRIGILYFAPHPIFDESIRGIREALQAGGLIDGRNLELRLVHPNGDMGLLPQVARQLTDADLDLMVPLSTPCLQALVAAPRRSPVVFGTVSSPVEAGAGRSIDDHLPDVTGAIWSAPNPRLFDWLRRVAPDVRSVGVLYNPSDANAFREKEEVRVLLESHGLRLVERTVANPSDVPQAAQSLLAAGVEAVFGMSDATVATAFAGLVQECRKGRVPLLADDASTMGSGALFSCGASPILEGRRTGRLILRVLAGESPASIPFAPSEDAETTVDLAAAAALGITLPTDLMKEAVRFFNPTGRLGRPFRIGLVHLVQNPLLDLADDGFCRGLSDAGFRIPEDVTVKRYSAQGEIAQLPAVVDAALAEQPDAIVTITTPALMAACPRVKTVPLIFAVASDPAVLGLFDADSRPANLVGVHDDPPVDRLLAMAARHVPGLAVVGTVYDPAQPNSMISVNKLRTLCRTSGIRLEEGAAASVTEMAEAARAVLERGAQALLLSADNLVSTAFPAIRKAADAAGRPVYVTSIELVRQGAAGAVGDNYEAWGAQAGLVAARVLAGVPPGAMPIEKTRLQDEIEPRDALPRRANEES